MPKNPAAVALGKMTSKKKAAAVRKNGKLGGRPRKTFPDTKQTGINQKTK